MSENQFPTEIVNLPSKGYFYPEGNPLSSGTIEIKYPGAYQEDILTTESLAQKGVVIDKFLESIIIDKAIKLDDMLVGDKNAILVASRILLYGKNYDYTTKCEACGDLNKKSVDLTTISEKKLDFEALEKGVNEFEFELPNSKRTLTFKLTTQVDENDIDVEVESLKKLNTGVTTKFSSRARKVILAVDGNRETKAVADFIQDEFLSQDILEFRKYSKSLVPDITSTHAFECDTCAYEGEVTIPFSVDFFWPSI